MAHSPGGEVFLPTERNYTPGQPVGMTAFTDITQLMQISWVKAKKPLPTKPQPIGTICFGINLPKWVMAAYSRTDSMVNFLNSSDGIKWEKHLRSD